MKINKYLKILSIILECSFFGSVILYAYNYYISVKKYEIVPIDVRHSLNTFIIIAVVSILLFFIIKYVLYLRNKTVLPNVSQLQMNFDELTQEKDLEREKLRQTINELEEKCRNLEAPVNERVIIYKDAYVVPKDRKMLCPNCKSAIDKNAYICIRCGYLLKQVKEEKIVEKIIEKPVYKEIYTKRSIFSNVKLKNVLINGSLIIGIIVCLILIINTAMERGIIG